MSRDTGPIKSNWLVQLLYVLGSLLILVLLVDRSPHWHMPDLSLHDKALRDQALAALFGAFVGAAGTGAVTIITDRLRDRRNRHHERRVKHYNAIVRLQRTLNTIRGILEDDIGIINTMIAANDAGTPTLQRPVEVQIRDESPFADVYDIKLINMLSQLYYDLRRFNFDMANLTHVQDVFAEEKFTGRMSTIQYRAEVSAINPQIIRLRDTLQKEIDQEVMDLVAYVRICADRDASGEMQQQLKRMLAGRPPITDDELQQTRETILSELDEQANS